VSISGCGISVSSTNVVIRNVRISLSNSESFAVIVRAGASVTIDHVQIAGLDQSNQSVEYAVLSQTDQKVTISHSNFFNCADCVQGENITMTSSYIHDMANPPGAHVDGFQCNSSCGVTVTGNTIFNQYGQTSAIALFADFGTPRNSTISGNLLAGGGYTIYGGTNSATGIVISNNRFSTLYSKNCGQYGVADDFSKSGNTWSGNIWDGTGQAATA
jgi:Right handed beta helix region